MMNAIDKRIIAMINETDPERKENLFNELRECYGQDFIPALFDCIKKHPQEVYFATQSLIGENIDDESIPFLIRMLKDKNYKIREISAECLGILRAKNACTDLVNLISDKNNNVRYEAVMSVGRLKCRKGASAILARLEMDKESDQFVFVEMVIALGHLNTKNAKRYLKNNVKKAKSFWAKVHFYTGLYLSGEHSYLNDIIRILNRGKGDRLSWVRFRTSALLAEIAEYSDHNTRIRIIEELNKAAETETIPGVLSRIREAIEDIEYEIELSKELNHESDEA